MNKKEEKMGLKDQDDVVRDVTDMVKKVLGDQVKYAAIKSIRDPEVEERNGGVVLNSEWDGEVSILFNNGAEISIFGSDYLSVLIKNKHQ